MQRRRRRSTCRCHQPSAAAPRPARVPPGQSPSRRLLLPASMRGRSIAYLLPAAVMASSCINCACRWQPRNAQCRPPISIIRCTTHRPAITALPMPAMPRQPACAITPPRSQRVCWKQPSRSALKAVLFYWWDSIWSRPSHSRRLARTTRLRGRAFAGAPHPGARARTMAHHADPRCPGDGPRRRKLAGAVGQGQSRGGESAPAGGPGLRHAGATSPALP